MKMKALRDFPEYVAAEEKLVKLQLRLTETENIIHGIHSAATETAKKIKADNRVQAIINDPGMDLRDVRADPKLADLYTTKSTLLKAIELQRKTISKLEMTVSKQICQEVRPQYKEIIQRAAKALQALSEIIEEERTFRNNLEDNGICFTSHISPMPIRHIGILDDEYSYINFWLNNASRDGYIEFKRESNTVDNDIPPQGKTTLACGPDGAREVLVLPGGKMKTKKWLHKTTEADRTRRYAPKAEWN